MKITLTPTESDEMFHNALCNGLGYIEEGYGLEFEYSEKEYQAAKETLTKGKDTWVCYEDVLIQILRDGGSLIMNDIECEGEYTSEITLKDVHERVAETPLRFLTQMINEEDDAETADVVLQTVFFKEIIFG
jgi:hypothetical protein